MGAWDDVTKAGTMLEGDGYRMKASSAAGRREADGLELEVDGRRRRPGWLRRWEVFADESEEEDDRCGGDCRRRWR